MPALGVIFWVFVVDIKWLIGDTEEKSVFTGTVRDTFYLGLLT